MPSGARPTGVSDIPSSSRRYATPGRPSEQWRPVNRCHRHHRRPPTPTISSVHTAAEGSTKPPPRGTFRFVRYDAELTPDKCCSQSNWCSHRAVTVADAKRKKRAHGRPPSIRIWNFFVSVFYATRVTLQLHVRGLLAQNLQNWPFTTRPFIV